MGTQELLYNGSLLTDQQEISKAFNEHFVNAGKCVQDSIEGEVVDPLKHVYEINDSFKFKVVTEYQICNIIERMQPKTSMGVDGVSNNLLKKLVHVIK